MQFLQSVFVYYLKTWFCHSNEQFLYEPVNEAWIQLEANAHAHLNVNLSVSQYEQTALNMDHN